MNDALPKPRLLLVDDSEVDRMFVRRAVGKDFYIAEAQNAADALELIQELPFVVALVDYNLPDADGLSLVEPLVLRGIAVVMLTGQGNERVAVAAMKAGASDYIVKDNALKASVTRAVQRALELRRLQDKITQQQDELKARVDELQRERKYVSAVLEAMPDVLVRIDRIGTCTDVFGRVDRVGSELYWPEGRSLSAAADPRGAKAIQAAVNDAFDGGDVCMAEASFSHESAAGNPTHVRQIECRVRALSDEDAVVVLRDITHQKSLQKRVQVSARLESLGRLAGGVAHDFNNLLTAIRGWTGFVRDDLRTAGLDLEDIDGIATATDRAAALTRQLMLFSRHQAAEMQEVDVPANLKGLQHLLERTIGTDLELRVHIQQVDLAVMADLSALEQVVINLVINARDAWHEAEPQGRRGRIEIEAGVATSSTLPGRHGVATEVVRIAVRDNGVGIPEAIRDRIFEPFYSTKTPDKGTGLGLAICFRAVEQFGGELSVVSEVGVGTTITVDIPRCASALSAIEPQSAVANTRGHGARILVVDDEEIVRRVVVRTLQRGGYDVLEADCGEIGIDMLKADPTIDMVLSDVMMPGISGVEVAQLTRSIKPTCAILLVTGYTDRQAEIDAMDVSVLSKPFNREQLLSTVREVLEQDTAAA